MMNEQIRNYMSHTVASVSPEVSLEEVSKFFKKNKHHHVAIVEENKLVGLITIYDLWSKNIPFSEYKNLKASDVLNTNVCKITPVDKVGTAAELFMDRRFHALPVVNLRGELKGVITSHDIIKYTLNKEYPTPILYKDVLTETLAARR